MDPQPVIPLEYAKERQSPFWARAARWLTPISWVIALMAWGLIWYEDESVLFTGPVLFTAGLLLIISGALIRDIGVIVLGLVHCGICVLFVGLVNLRGWGSDDAHVSFLILGAIHLLMVSGPISLTVHFSRPARTIP